MPDNANAFKTGGCLCGSVRFEIAGPLRDVVNCYCTMCQKLHGSFGAHSKARKDHIRLIKSDGLKWYRTSEIAQRGYCTDCGSSLFWQPDQQDSTGILAGALDQPSGLKTIGHIFVGEKADFCEITDGLPQFKNSSDGGFPDDQR